MTLPTLKDLNNLSCAQTTLLLFRGLSTSDLSWHYMLLKKETLADLLATHIDLISGQEELATLTSEEKAELTTYFNDIQDYISHN